MWVHAATISHDSRRQDTAITVEELPSPPGRLDAIAAARNWGDHSFHAAVMFHAAAVISAAISAVVRVIILP